MDEKLYINDVLLEIPKRTVSRSLQINDFRETKDRQANYSNSIKIPKTYQNTEAFESLGLVGIVSRIPYQSVKVKYVVNGIEMITDGKGVLKNTNDFYNLVIYDGNISLTDLLGTETLQDLDFSSYNHNLTTGVFLSSFSNTSGYIYALEDRFDVVIENSIPSFYIHTLFDMILTQKGWSYSGSIFSDSDYLSRVTTMDIGFEVDVTQSETQVFNILNTSTRSNTVSEKYLINSYTSTSNDLYKVELNGSVEIVFGSVELSIEVNGSAQLFFTPLSNVNFNEVANVYAETGDLIEVYGIATVETTPVTQYRFEEDFRTIIYKNEKYIPITFEDIIGNTKQIDFVKDVMQRFNLSFKKTKNENALEFITSEELLTDTNNAEDWSNLFSKKIDESYRSSYAQDNQFKYKYEDSENNFADGSLIVDDVNLKSEKTAVTSFFKVGGEFSYWNEENEPEQDDLRIYKIDLSSMFLQFRFEKTDNKTSLTLSVAQLDFMGLDYQTEIDNNYVAFKKFLDDYKIIIAEVNLDSIDIYSLDFFKLKYIKQLGRYFYLNKVNGFKEGYPTKVELIQAPL